MNGGPSLAFVSAPGGSAFMAELLYVVADAVTRSGGHATCVEGTISDAKRADAYVVIPHEYFSLTGDHDPALLARTIGFGVEHPGTATFSSVAASAGYLGANVAISAEAVTEMQRRGISVQRFELGLSPVWDRRQDAGERDVDLVYLGTADRRRLGELAKILPDLAGHRTEVLLPPHEPMTQVRPDFLTGEAKWRLLARSRMLLNLHREGSTSFEWVRGLEAISNDCAILTSPSTGLDPLVPGEHVLVGEVPRLGGVAIAALDDPSMLERVAREARARCEAELDMVASAARLVDLASTLVDGQRTVKRVARVPLIPVADEPPMAGWLPMARPLPSPSDAAVDRGVVRSSTPSKVTHPQTSRDARVDVICVRSEADGSLWPTLSSLKDARASVHIAFDGMPGSAIDVDTVVTLPEQVGRASARNQLLAQGSAPYVLVLDAGDEMLDGWLDRLVETLEGDLAIDIAYPMAVHGSELVINAMVPEARRLRTMPYLTRGYLVRRTWLEAHGGFAEDLSLEGWVDHELWVRAARLGARVEHLRSVGVRLWPQNPAPTYDPAALHQRLAASAT